MGSVAGPVDSSSSDSSDILYRNETFVRRCRIGGSSRHETWLKRRRHLRRPTKVKDKRKRYLRRPTKILQKQTNKKTRASHSSGVSVWRSLAHVGSATTSVGENVGTMGANPFFDALRTKICANEARKCAYVEASFELNKRRPHQYFMNFYPLYEGLNNYILTKRCNHEGFQEHFAARP